MYIQSLFNVVQSYTYEGLRKLPFCVGVILWNCIGALEIRHHSFLVWTLDGNKWSAFHSSYFHPGEETYVQQLGVWLDKGANLNMMEKRKMPFFAWNWMMVIHAVASHLTDWAILCVCVWACACFCVLFNTKWCKIRTGRDPSATVFLVLSNYPGLWYSECS